MSNKPFSRDQVVRHAITRDLGEIGSKPITQADGSIVYEVWWESIGRETTEDMLIEPLDRHDLQNMEQLRSRRRYDPYPKQMSIHYREQSREKTRQAGEKAPGRHQKRRGMVKGS